MGKSRGSSIRLKLLGIILASVLAPSMLGLAFLARAGIDQLERDLTAKNVVVASTIGSYSAAELAFEDRKASAETLAKLVRMEDVEYAALYDLRGQLFSSYRRPGATTAPTAVIEADAPPRVSQVGADFVDVYRPVLHDDARYGTIVLRTSTAPLKDRTRDYLLTVVFAGLAVALASFVLAVVLDRVVSKPILELAGTARAVGAKGDYSMRAVKSSDDEIGDLCSALNGMLAEVERRQREAEEAVRVRDQFISVASHELKTPMTSLKLQIQQLGRHRAKHHGNDDEHATSRRLELMLRQIDRLDKLVSTLLDVSRIMSGRLELEREEVDLRALVREVVEQIEPQAAEKGTPILVVADGPALGTWDRSRLEAVVTNLLTNALKFGQGKPVEVSVETDESTVRLTVRDQGIGISPEDTKRIFERFERAVSSRQYSGLGLGLFITSQIVGAHGGTIEVESEVGVGSKFTVVLPRRAPLEAEPPVFAGRAPAPPVRRAAPPAAPGRG